MRYGGNFSAVNDFSFFEGNDFGGNVKKNGGKPSNTVTGHQGGKFLSVKLPRKFNAFYSR